MCYKPLFFNQLSPLIGVSRLEPVRQRRIMGVVGQTAVGDVLSNLDAL